MAAEKKIKLVIKSDLKDVYLIDMLVETLCSLVHLPDDKSFWIKLCAVEAVNNSIIHAYRKSPDHEVAVIFTLHLDRIVIQVCDTGISIPTDLMTRAGIEGTGNGIMEVSDRGRGIAIIREIMDDVSYGTDNGHNCLTMIKRLI